MEGDPDAQDPGAEASGDDRQGKEELPDDRGVEAHDGQSAVFGELKRETELRVVHVAERIADRQGQEAVRVEVAKSAETEFEKRR